VSEFLDILQRSERWFEFRKAGAPGNPYRCAVGASEVADAIGYNGKAAQVALWQSKSGLLKDREANYAMQRGKALEPRIKQLYEAATKTTGAPVVCYRSSVPFMFASLDWTLPDHSVIAEMKYHDKLSHFMVHAGKVPAKNAIQIQAQLFCSEAEVCHLASISSWGSFAFMPVFPSPDRAPIPWSRMLSEVEKFCIAVTKGEQPDYSMGIASDFVNAITREET